MSKYFQRFEGIFLPSLEEVCDLEDYNVEELYREGIKIIDEIFAMADVSKEEFDGLIDYFLYLTGKNKYDFFIRNPVTDTLIDFLIYRYQDKLSDEFIFNYLFSIFKEENFKKFVEQHQEKLRRFIEENEFYIQGNDWGNKIHIPSGVSLNCYYFYITFKEKLKLSDEDWDVIFRGFSKEQLQTLLISSLNKTDEHSERLINSETTTNFLKRNLKYITPSFFEFYLQLLKRGAQIAIDDESIFSEQCVRDNSVINTTNNLKLSYLHKLGILQKISVTERKKHPYYIECYNIFYDIMTSRIKDLTIEDEYIIEELFNRILEGESFLLITSFNTKAGLKLYYRTNFYFKNKKNIPTGGLDEISVEQWNYIKDNYFTDFRFDFLNMQFSSIIIEDTYYYVIPDELIELACVMGFDFLYFLNEKSKQTEESDNIRIKIVSLLGKIMKNGFLQEKACNEKIKCFLIDFINDGNLEIDHLPKYLSIFIYLYKKNYPNLSLHTLKSLIATEDVLKFFLTYSNDKLKVLYNCFSLEIIIYGYLTEAPNATFCEYLNSLMDDQNTRSFSYNHLPLSKTVVILLEIFVRKIELVTSQNEDDKNLGFFYKLGILNKIVSNERVKHPYYIECYNMFYDIMKKRIKDLTIEDEYIIRQLFHRIINGASFFLITSINNRASLLLYYKTNFYFENKINLTTQDLERISGKQWIYIVNRYLIQPEYTCSDYNLTLSSFSLHGYTYLSENFVEIVLKLGYEFLESLTKTKNATSDNLGHILEVISSLALEQLVNDEYKQKFQRFIIEILNDGKLDIEIIKKYINTFNYLYKYKDSHTKLTLQNIKDVSNDVSTLLFPNNYHIIGALNKLDFVAKGEPLAEKIEGIVLYNKYRRRVLSSIPNYTNDYNGLEFGTVDMHDVNIISNGIGKYISPKGELCSSCLTPRGKAASDLYHGALNQNGRFFAVKKNGEIVAYSWVWRVGNVLCFDNIEFTEEYLKIADNERTICEIFMQSAKDFIKISESLEEIPIQVVVLGRSPVDVKNTYFDALPDVKERYNMLFKPSDSEKLYLKDSSEKQVILMDNKGDKPLVTKDVKPIYLVKRNPVIELGNNMSKVNAIYFDYCIERCIEYHPLSREDFKYGFIGDDWFWGEKSDGSTVLYETLDDERRKDEIKLYTTSIKEQSSNIYPPTILTPSADRLNYLLKNKSYEPFILEELTEYLQSITAVFPVNGNEFFHGTSSTEKFMQILKDRSISSADVRGDQFFGGNNGRYFISVAKINSEVYNSVNQRLGFLLKGISAFNIQHESFLVKKEIDLDFLIQSDYCFRPGGANGEYQVFGAIPLDRVGAIMLPCVGIDMGKAIYLAEECGYNLPFVYTPNMTVIDPKKVKMLIKVR